MTTWIMTGTGRKIDFLQPDPDQITLIDICMSLARNHRFGGHCPVKVAQHILEVVTLMLDKAVTENPNITLTELADIALVGLLHDFPEYVCVDVPTPLKRLLGPAYADIEERMLNCMLQKWDLVEAYAKHGALLKWADSQAVQQEAVRYKMDGWFLTDTLELLEVPRSWVPEDVVVTLRDDVWDEELLCQALSLVFIRFMFLSGRGHLIGGNWMKVLTEESLATGRSIGDIVVEPAGLPPMLIGKGSAF